ncbi:MAG: MFS transporter [archaeon]|nr:MFS transporter [archaeon]
MPENQNKKTIKTFAAASFLNDMGSDMIYPIWPLFVTTVLGANMAILGFIDGLGIAIVSISQALSGYISDITRKRKIFIWLGYLLGSISRVGYAFSTAWPHLIPFKVLDRFGKIRGAPRDAIVADISEEHERGKNFGLLRAMDHLGATVGILITIAIFTIVGYRTLFIIAAIPSLISVFLIYHYIKEPKTSHIKLHKGMTLKNITTNFRIFMISSITFALSSFSYSFLLIYAKEFGYALAFIPVLYLIFTLTASITSIPFGRLSDTIGRKKVMAVSYLLWALVCLTLITAPGKTAILLAFILYGLHIGALEPVQKTFVSELSAKKYRASSLGTFQMLIGLSALPSSVIAGLLWDRISIFAPFYFSLALTITAIILLSFVKKDSESGQKIKNSQKPT